MVHVHGESLSTYYSAHIQSWRAEPGSLTPTLDLKANKSQCFNHRNEVKSAVVASEVQVGPDLDGVLYIAQTSYTYIWDFVRQEGQPALLTRESSAWLTRYSLDTWIRYSTYLPIFMS
jgi:hypothetical protein